MESPFVLQNGFMQSGGIIYVTTAGISTTVFYKEEPIDKNITWAKSYAPHFIFPQGVVMSNDESLVYSINFGSNAIQILKVSATDGNLIMRYEE